MRKNMTILSLALMTLTFSSPSFASRSMAGGALRVPLNGETVDFAIKSTYFNVKKDQFSIEAQSLSGGTKYFSLKLSYLKDAGIEPAALSKLLLDSSLQSSLFCTVSTYTQNEAREKLECEEIVVSAAK